MNQLIENKFLLVCLAIIVGTVLGHLLLRPIFAAIGKTIAKKDENLGALIIKLGKLSALLGVVLLLNVISAIPYFSLYEGYLDKAIRVITILSFTYIICELLLYAHDLYHRTKSKQVTSIFHIIIRLLIYAIGLFSLLNAFGIEITPILTALGVGGLAVALALQDTLSNLFSGIQILGSRQVKPGDYIRLESGEEGYVLDINWRNTEIKTLLGNFVIIPNSKISSSTTTNYYALQQRLYFHVIVGVHYDSDLEEVERITIEVADELMKESPKMPKSLKPKVRFIEFADSSINMRVWLSTDTYENQFQLKHQFIKKLHKRFNKAGIVIPFPIRTIYMAEQGNGG